jgi:hypothetical protein
MRAVYSILLFTSAVACAAPASDPTPEPPPGVLLELAPSVSVEVGRKCVLTATTTAKKVTWSVPPGADAMPLDGRRLAVWAPPGTYVFRAMVPNGDDVVATETVLTVTGPRPPPGPNPPEPIPPTPQPVTSFRVIFVYESGDTLPVGQAAVMDAKAVRDYLGANTTRDGNTAGWRRYDKDISLTNETPTFKALWEAVKTKLTVVPCVAIEVNGKVDILPFPATPAEAVALFRKYRGN